MRHTVCGLSDISWAVYVDAVVIYVDAFSLKNSFAPGRFWLNFRWVMFKQILVIDGWVFSCEITLRWTSQGLTDDKSTLVQVMAWCCQATSHYLNQCWPRSISPYGVTRPQCVNWLKGFVMVMNVLAMCANTKFGLGIYFSMDQCKTVVSLMH